MRNSAIRCAGVCLAVVMCCAFVMADTSVEQTPQAQATMTLSQLECVMATHDVVPMTPVDGSVAKGKPNPAPACCDPDLQPGVNGNPFCFEGATCCSDGRWQCNNPDGSPSCSAGTVCSGCSGAGAACSSNSDCCSGKCKGKRCR